MGPSQPDQRDASPVVPPRESAVLTFIKSKTARRIVIVAVAFGLGRLCKYAPEGWPAVLCELLARLARALP